MCNFSMKAIIFGEPLVLTHTWCFLPVFFRHSSTTNSLDQDRRVPIVTSTVPLFFISSFFYLELLIYRGHWRGSRRSVKSLNVMRCYYLRGRRLSKSRDAKVVMQYTTISTEYTLSAQSSLSSIPWSMPNDKGFYPRVILDDGKLNN